MAVTRTLEQTAIKPRPDFNQLLKALLRNGKPDYIPFYELFVNREVIEAVLGKKIEDRLEEAEFYYRAGYDYVPAWPDCEMVRGDLVDRRKGYPIKNRKDFEKFDWPGKADIGWKGYVKTAEVLPKGMKIAAMCCFAGGVLETVESLLGYENLCVFLYEDRALVSDVFERVAWIYEWIYTGMTKQKDVGVVTIHDDMGFKTQTLISPKDLREFVLPTHRKMAEIAHKAGLPVILHSCGQLGEIMDDIIDYVKIDAKHSYEDAIMPVTEAKKKYGKSLALLGGFDMDKLCKFSEQEIRQHTKMLMDTCGADGGYAIGSGNSIPGYIPLENYLTMLDEAWKTR
jgi:uroporphyrinogen decarboxylase